MKILVIAAGRPSLPHARLAVEDYTARIRRLAKPVRIELRCVPSGPAREEGAALLRAAAGCLVVPLDPAGLRLTSGEFAARLGRHLASEHRDIAFLIGGADGHAPEVLSAAAWTLSLGPMTLQHELALVVLLEQIYRALTILKGHPYHRA